MPGIGAILGVSALTSLAFTVGVGIGIGVGIGYMVYNLEKPTPTSYGSRTTSNRSWDTVKRRRNSTEVMDCVICRNTKEEAGQHRLLCGHLFHVSCINTYLEGNSRCPSCRTIVK